MEKDLNIPQIKPNTGDIDDLQKNDAVAPVSEAQAVVEPVSTSTIIENKNDKFGFVKKFFTKQKSVDPTQAPKPVSKNVKIIKWALLVLVIIFLAGIVVPGVFVALQAKKVMASAQGLKATLSTKDISQIKNGMNKLKTDLNGLKKVYVLTSLARVVPFVSGYWNDGSNAINGGIHGLEAAEIIVNTIEPYADIVGLTGQGGAKSGEENAEDRIQFIVETIDQIVPQLDTISAKVALVDQDFSKINPNRYPEKIGDKEVRSQLVEALALLDDATKLVTEAKPILQKAPYLLGVDGERTYLLLFQNDKELRPTGGFMTAYSVMKVNKGKINNVTSNDIYNLDTKYKPATPAPEPIVNYIKGPYIQSKNLRLRDMNFDPDFKSSMDLFYKEAGDILNEDIDGIIAVDTHVLVKILDVIGEIGVPGFGNFSNKIIADCNCPQVIYELESFADVEGPIIWDPVTGKIILRPPNSDNRKRIVGPLMNSILSNAMGQPKEKIPGLFEAAFESLLEKHVLFYMLDSESQKAVEDFNVAGRIKDYPGDYLHINDSNLGGRKSNLYVTQEVDQEINIARDGSIEKTVTITYKNPEKQDGWLNSVLPNWVRVYVPKGATLVDFAGVEDKKEPYEEYGKTVFAGYFELRPQGVAKVTLTYKLPFKTSDLIQAKQKIYNLLVQKQPGTDMPLYTIHLGKSEVEQFLKTDEEFKLNF